MITALKIPQPEELPGIDLLDDAARKDRKVVFGECFTHNANDLDDPKANLRWRWAVRGQWKLIVPNQAIERDAKNELYDLVADPLETKNLVLTHPEIELDLLSQLDAWWK